MSDCCDSKPKKKFSYALWIPISIVIVFYVFHFFAPGPPTSYSSVFSDSVFDLFNKMSWGLLIGIFFAGLLGKIPRDLVMAVLGRNRGIGGILRATAAGVLLDLCSHGILIVGMRLYERGARLGQVMAFLIASPWNSLSLTLVLWALIGFWWMMAFLLLSMLIAVISGLIFEKLVDKKVLPPNPNSFTLADNFKFWPELRKYWKSSKFTFKGFMGILIEGLKGSKMILKWIFIGIILASLLRTFLTPENFETVFGPTLAGLGLTLLIATIIEVCSEGSTPIAADILTRAGAPGNSFAFLMTGVATDYTEVMSLKETTSSWKIALFLPLITLPQVIFIALLLNGIIL